jgi:hypothetical protein
MNVGDDMTSSQEPAREAVAGFSVVTNEFRFRVLTIRSEDVPVAFDLDFPCARLRSNNAIEYCFPLCVSIAFVFNH